MACLADPSGEGPSTSTVVTADDAELDRSQKPLPENTRAMVNAMSTSIQPAKKKKAGNSKSLGIKFAKKEKPIVTS